MSDKMESSSLQETPFSDERWDFLTKDDRKAYLLNRIKNQIDFMKKEVPFYEKYYRQVNITKIKSVEDCVSRVPSLKKENIRNLSTPYSLLPLKMTKTRSSIYLHQGTGGTTGEPTSTFFSKADWQATTDTMIRPLKELREFLRDKPLIAFNGYNQGHIAGPIFNDTVRKLGGVPILRSFRADDALAVRQMAKHRCNLLICPPTSTHKGGTLEDLLSVDSRIGTNYINGNNIDCLFFSSTPTTKALMEEIEDLGIRFVFNFYGTTDALPTAISCRCNPDQWHIMFGHTNLFVVDEDQHHVKNGQRGRIMSGRIASFKSNRVNNNEAMQIFNFHVGDEVLFIDKLCKCGRITPRITDIKRVKDTKEKLESGCEVW